MTAVAQAVGVPQTPAAWLRIRRLTTVPTRTIKFRNGRTLTVPNLAYQAPDDVWGAQDAPPRVIDEETRARFKEMAAKKREERQAAQAAKPRKTGPSVKQVICEGIMAGQPEAEIFQAAQAVGLAANRKSYVKWYWKWLTKQGKNPPKLKEG